METGQTISHYRIVRKLGGGGMGVVYEAEDLSLRRRVALKFLPDDLAESADALVRFKREARAASALNHPNICTIYEVNHNEGRPFIVMELIKGQTLKHTIGGKPMGIDQVLELGAQIADAMEAAHAEKIIHRDIKPANIFVTDRGQVKLLDFGLAKKTPLGAHANAQQATESVSESLTETGTTIGTLSYMSPEQARGRQLDERTDLFSFGVVLYEMVTGILPFEGQSPGEILEAIFTFIPTPSVRLNPKVPERLEMIIGKALEKNRDLRYQSAAEMRTDLQRLRRDTSVGSVSTKPPATTKEPFTKTKLWVTASVVVFIALIAIYWFGRTTQTLEKTKASITSSTTSATTSIAILPFVDLSPEKNQEYFTDGLAEELLNVLAKNPKLRVVARTSAFAFKGKNEDLRLIGQKLNVSNILEGSVRKEGNRVRITTQLVNTADGFRLWSETYDRKSDDIFAVQDDIAASVAGALKVTLGGEMSAPMVQTGNAEAYNAYLKGRYFYDRLSKEDLETAIAYYKEALRFDPNYARAWAGLATVHGTQADQFYMPVDESYQKARHEVKKALELDPNQADAYAALGSIKKNYYWDWAGADVAYKRALDLEPGNATIVQRAAVLSSTLGRFDEAVTLYRRAIELDPLSVTAHSNLGLNYYYAGRLEEAEATLKKALELNPQYPTAHENLGRIFLAQSKPEAALAEMQKEPDAVWRLDGLALAYHAAGKKNEADSGLAEFIEKYQNGFAFQIAEIYAYRGETDKALEWLERAYKLRDGGLTQIKGNPLLQSLELDPRYAAFLKKMGLPV